MTEAMEEVRVSKDSRGNTRHERPGSPSCNLFDFLLTIAFRSLLCSIPPVIPRRSLRRAFCPWTYDFKTIDTPARNLRTRQHRSRHFAMMNAITPEYELIHTPWNLVLDGNDG
jgi:hypothetical protein